MLTLTSVPSAVSGRSQFRAEWIDVSGPHPSLRHLGRKLAAMYEGLSQAAPDAGSDALRRNLATAEQADRAAAQG